MLISQYTRAFTGFINTVHDVAVGAPKGARWGYKHPVVGALLGAMAGPTAEREGISMARASVKLLRKL
jgi:hypothetical protein